MTKRKQQQICGTIDPDLLYTLPKIQELTGLGKAALRDARRNGVVRYVGNRGFILGADFIRFTKEFGKTCRESDKMQIDDSKNR